MGEQEWFNQDFYKTLGVSKDADATEIKKAYRKLARQWHPDQNPGDPKAEEKFKEISEAYSVLSDKDQRERYDAIQRMAAGGARFSAGPNGGAGAGGFEDLFGSMFGGAGPRPGAGGYAGGGYSNPNIHFQTSGGGGFDDILSGLFGGGGAGPGGYSRAPQPTRGSDLTGAASIGFLQAYEGTSVKMTVGGKALTAKIPAGVRDGQKIRLRGKGAPGQNGGPAGDLLITVSVEKHPVYSQEGNDLRVKLPITYPEAVLGARVEVPLPDGTSVKLKVPAGSSSGKILRVRGRGRGKGGRKGDILVELGIVVPARANAEAEKAVQDLAAGLGGWDPRAEMKVRV